MNKSDLVAESEIAQITKKLQSYNASIQMNEVVLTSKLDSQSRNRVLTSAREIIGDLSYLDQAVLSSTRQLEGAQQATEMIDKALLELEKNLGAEFVAMYLKEALVALQRILGHVYDDQILDRVFKEFCLGK
jgi:tRNA modification GTPase